MLKKNMLYVLYITTILVANMQAADCDTSAFKHIAGSLRECIATKIVKDEKNALQTFHQHLKDQEAFITTLERYPELYADACRVKDSVEREHAIFKHFDATNENNNDHDTYTFKFTSNNAFAWSMRYKHLNTLLNASSNAQLNEAEAILKKWKKSDDREIPLLVELFANKLQSKKWIKRCEEFKANISHTAGVCASFCESNMNYQKDNSPFIYVISLWTATTSILKLFGSNIDELAKKDQEEAQQVEAICTSYKRNAHIKNILEQLDKKIKSLEAPANKEGSHDEFLPDHLKNNAKKLARTQSKKHPQQKKKSKTRNKRKGKAPATHDDDAQAVLSKKTPEPAPKVYPLSSSILEEDDIHVTIKDIQNNVLITLWKVANPQEHYSSPQYTHAINLWFNDPEQAMEEQGYNNPDHAKYHLRESAQLVHSFSPEADQYVTQCGIVSDGVNNKNKQHIAITMPGYITHHNGHERHGLFTYFIDTENGQWYHRNFVEKTREKLYAEYMNAGLYEVEFPELQQSTN